MPLEKQTQFKKNNHLTAAGSLDIEAAVCSENRNQTLDYIGIEFYMMGVTPATSTYYLCRYHVAVGSQAEYQQDAELNTLLAGL